MKIVTQDGVEIRPNDGRVFWYLRSCGMGAYEAYPITNPHAAGPFLFFSGVGMRGSLHAVMLNEMVPNVFADKNKLEAMAQMSIGDLQCWFKEGATP